MTTLKFERDALTGTLTVEHDAVVYTIVPKLVAHVRGTLKPKTRGYDVNIDDKWCGVAFTQREAKQIVQRWIDTKHMSDVERWAYAASRDKMISDVTR